MMKIAFLTKGMISEGDIDGAIDMLQKEYPAVGVHLRGGERGRFSMLVDWQGLEGWEKGAKTLGTLTTRTIGDAVGRSRSSPMLTLPTTTRRRRQTGNGAVLPDRAA
jgi:hypothetical protein